MKAALREFMPYGAPELIEARPAFQARALALASATAVAIYALLMGLGSLIHERDVDARACEPLQHQMISPPQAKPIPPPDAPAAFQSIARSTVEKFAAPVPVPDAEAPSDLPPSAPGGSATAEVRGEPQAQPTPGDRERVPGPTEWVNVERLPEPLKRVNPTYDDIAKAAGVEGTVLLRVLVGKDGRVMDVRVDDKTQVPMLNDAAVAAARQWLFTPGMSNDRPVLCWVSIPFRFSLH